MFMAVFMGRLFTEYLGEKKLLTLSCWRLMWLCCCIEFVSTIRSAELTLLLPEVLAAEWFLP